MNNSAQLASGQNLPAENIAWAKICRFIYFKTGDLEKAENP
jgi:hypothetical protein